eukprot:8483891-Pyramimonas_sp.AAC.1
MLMGSHRRPLPFRIRLCGQTFGHRLATLLHHALPQPFWKSYGEHVGEEEEDEEKEEKGR